MTARPPKKILVDSLELILGGRIKLKALPLRERLDDVPLLAGRF